MSDERQGEMVIRREERKLDQAKAKLEAYEKNMTDTLAAFLKDARNKKNLAQDAMSATKDPSRRDAMKAAERSGGSGYFDNKEGEELDIITGLEDRPWER